MHNATLRTRERRLCRFPGFLAGAAKQTRSCADVVLVKVHAVSDPQRTHIMSAGFFSSSSVNDINIVIVHNIADNLVPRSDAACEIIAVGPDVKGWSVGQRARAGALGALAPGVLTEYRTFPAHSLVEIPEHLSYEEASTLPCAGVTAYNALLGSKPTKGGDYVLVLGTGGVSLFALQIAVASGAVVIATSSSNEKPKFASKWAQPRYLINYTKTTPNWDEEVLRITNGRGVDHVIEVGGSGTLIKSVNSIRIGGSVDVMGFLSSMFQDFNCLITAHKIKPVVDKVFDFEQAVGAYQHLASQKHIGNVIIKVAKD
ncbi:hypothetical protein BDV98DRAFT_610783 [Pterulicium gracile]|uniref:Enoyl reductase (ER) domain-containing protein n=1 Tax=Pterulicium gracile TaxID=1884261 RepID=A0A5C3QTE4_9AGAR|nr:hypothetical protein BDV98DRAFT_610783 [Pterula gracilis]